MSVYCQQCGEERTEEDTAAKTPCPNCGSTKFHYVIHVETGRFHLEGNEVTVETQRAFEVAKWESVFQQMELAKLRTVCEGSIKPVPSVPPGYEVDIAAIANHVYEERNRTKEWKNPHAYIPIIISIIALLVAILK